MRTQPWIHCASIDTAFILAPAVIATLIALAINAAGHAQAGVSLAAWAVLVIGIDVAHVYSTLYRTYLDPFERRQLSGWLIGTPLATWVLGVLLYTWSAATFWSVLAYTAVFHFVRQQYGFLMLYSRGERAPPAWSPLGISSLAARSPASGISSLTARSPASGISSLTARSPASGIPSLTARSSRRLDQATIYGATLFPLLYWHTHLPRPFVWFTDGDFLALPAVLWRFALPLYIALFAAYLAKEVALIYRTRSINWPRNALILGTALSWYVGIVAAAGDLVFTLTNVVAHGIPYMALTCIYARRRDDRAVSEGAPSGDGRVQNTRSLFVLRLLPYAIGLLVVLAFVEEGLWDGLIWREHLALFPGFQFLPHIQNLTTLSLLVPLLSVPQMTHYVIDGVIWRLRTQPEWRKTLFWQPSNSPAQSAS